ncbi:hypothetical protein [Aeromicrobium sp.]|uniref:hypothetical protein n=1 Tax=Aeromicrobium sp. TaxID=1871063 RepID=UPI0019930B2A|nr:hypothetical protein [Aeromicrobium sp.]MBC7631280.1 hypothetical protein [Aeromicrobium sp.]
MPAPKRIPDDLLHGPFTPAMALAMGISEKVLRGSRFVRLFPCVWVHVDHPMTNLDWIVASEHAMPERAQLSHVSRIQRLGLDFGQLRPFHFTIAGDHHLTIADIFLHRTELLPPLDEGGVTPATAFIQLCATARMIDAIIVGDWLLRGGHLSVLEVAEVARRDDWRPGARQVRAVLSHLDTGSRSPKESESRAVLVFAGLPRPEVNKNVHDSCGAFLGCGDLVYLLWKLLVEYEGRQHEGDLHQWNIDIDRYRGFRDEGWQYVQVTSEKLRTPKKLVSEVFAQLVRGGYDGPPPVFAARWNALFGPIVVHRNSPQRAAG